MKGRGFLWTPWRPVSTAKCVTVMTIPQAQCHNPKVCSPSRCMSVDGQQGSLQHHPHSRIQPAEQTLSGSLSFTVGEHKSALVGLPWATKCSSRAGTRGTSAQLIGQNESHSSKPLLGPGGAIPHRKDRAGALIGEGGSWGSRDARGLASFDGFNPHAPGCEIGL